MVRLLLDTRIFILTANDSPRLRPTSGRWLPGRPMQYSSAPRPSGIILTELARRRQG